MKPALARALSRYVNPVLRRVAGRIPVMSLVIHQGRKSGREYRTPADSFRQDDVIRFALPFGPDSDWVRNVLAAGRFRLLRRGDILDLADPEVHHDASHRWAPGAVRPLLAVLGIDDYLEARLRKPG